MTGRADHRRFLRKCLGVSGADAGSETDGEPPGLGCDETGPDPGPQGVPEEAADRQRRTGS